MADNFKEIYPYEKGFCKYYEKELIPLLHQVEKHRTDALMRFIIVTGACIIAIVIIPILINIIFDEIEWTYGSCGLLIITTFFLLKHMIDRFKNEAATRVNEKLVKFFGDFNYIQLKDKYTSLLKTMDVTVKNEPGITNNIVSKIGLLFPSYDEITYENIIYGNHNDNEIEFCKLKMEQDLFTDSAKGYMITTFKGLLIVVTLQKKLTGKTFIAKKGFFSNSTKYEKVKFKDKPFKNHYEVSTTNLTETNSILTTTTQQAIIELAKSFNQKSIKGCFYGNKLVIAIPTKKNHFGSVSLFKSAFKKNALKTFLRDFNSILTFSNNISGQFKQINDSHTP